MPAKFWNYPLVQRSVVATACLIGLAGCRAENPHDNASGHEEEHAGHVIPAHKPKTFPDAVHRLRELNDQFRSGSMIDRKNLGIALDIANWLPEIAADSDLPEPQWNEVNTRSAQACGRLSGAHFRAQATARTELEQANTEIGSLEKLLLACEPRWFEGTAKIVAAP